jgi:hypothetical protein
MAGEANGTGGLREWLGGTFVPSLGCYAWQVDGTCQRLQGGQLEGMSFYGAFLAFAATRPLGARCALGMG